MKKFSSILIVLVLIFGAMALTGCSVSEQSKTEAKIQQTVAKQDTIYNETEPIPLFNYSLPRHMWIQFYKATTTKVVRTWSAEVALSGRPLTEVVETIGYPIPMDTQLTNPQKLSSFYSRDADGTGSGAGWISGTLAQSEPNGLYTSPNTNATIYFTLGDDGSVAPCYAETFVVCKPYPFHWDETKQVFVRDKGAQSTLKLDTKGAEGTTTK